MDIFTDVFYHKEIPLASFFIKKNQKNQTNRVNCHINISEGIGLFNQISPIGVSEMKINWKKKLTDRRLWAAVIGFIAPVLLAFGVADKTVAEVTAAISAGAAVVSFVIADNISHSSDKGGSDCEKDDKDK